MSEHVADREPLSADEEAALRRQFLDGATYWVGPVRVARLLATLDAVRSQPDEAGLREAERYLTPMEHLPARMVSDPDDMPRCVGCRFLLTPRSGHQIDCPVGAYLAALAQPAVPVAGAEEPLLGRRDEARRR